MNVTSWPTYQRWYQGPLNETASLFFKSLQDVRNNDKKRAIKFLSSLSYPSNPRSSTEKNMTESTVLNMSSKNRLNKCRQTVFTNCIEQTLLSV